MPNAPSEERELSSRNALFATALGHREREVIVCVFGACAVWQRTDASPPNAHPEVPQSWESRNTMLRQTKDLQVELLSESSKDARMKAHLLPPFAVYRGMARQTPITRYRER